MSDKVGLQAQLKGCVARLLKKTTTTTYLQMKRSIFYRSNPPNWCIIYIYTSISKTVTLQDWLQYRYTSFISQRTQPSKRCWQSGFLFEHMIGLTTKKSHSQKITEAWPSTECYELNCYDSQAISSHFFLLI